MVSCCVLPLGRETHFSPPNGESIPKDIDIRELSSRSDSWPSLIFHLFPASLYSMRPPLVSGHYSLTVRSKPLSASIPSVASSSAALNLSSASCTSLSSIYSILALLSSNMSSLAFIVDISSLSVKIPCSS